MAGAIIDSDQHLYETRTLWRDYIDPRMREEALRIEDDDLGTPLLRWHERVLSIAEVQVPGCAADVGDRHRRVREGRPLRERYDDVLPRDYWEPSARLAKLADLGVDEAILFPNYGLLWERKLQAALPAQLANMAAWNRWCAEVVRDGGGRLHPVAHLSLRDPDWLLQQLALLERAGIRLAMIAPAVIDGRPLSHPNHDRLWSAFCAHGITPVFHIADQVRPFDDAWYTDEAEAFVPAVEAVFLHVPAALACTDLILNGVFERLPELRLGIVELSSLWVPLFLLMLDGAWSFTNQINGWDPPRLPLLPSEYFRRQVRVSSFAYERPAALQPQLGADLLMACSDYPHSEGTATPLADYEAFGCRVADAPGLFTTTLPFCCASGEAVSVSLDNRSRGRFPRKRASHLPGRLGSDRRTTPPA